MKLTKLGHCCFLVEAPGVKVITDPGAYSTAQDDIINVDAVLITHEHQDHIHIPSLEAILENNPFTMIITNASVGKILVERGMTVTVVSSGEKKEVKGMTIEAVTGSHALIHNELPSVENTGFVLNDRIWYPGDAFMDLNKKIEVLLLPVAGPWMKLHEAISYAEKIKPKVAIPVHDGMLRPDRLGPVHRIPEQMLGKSGIKFVPLLEGESYEVL